MTSFFKVDLTLGKEGKYHTPLVTQIDAHLQFLEHV